MMWILVMQISFMGQKHGAPRELPVNQWYYPVEKVVMKKGSLTVKEKGVMVFGEPALFTGSCNGIENKVLTRENCTIYYRTDIKDIKGRILKFVLRGRGKFRISIYSPLGFTSKVVELNDKPVEVEIDLSRSIAITQHRSEGPLRIVFTPLQNGEFTLEVSNFVLKQEG